MVTLPARSVAGSNAMAAGFTDVTIDLKISDAPSAVRWGRSMDTSTPTATGSGAPVACPDASSMPMRQIPIDPPRSLAK